MRPAIYVRLEIQALRHLQHKVFDLDKLGITKTQLQNIMRNVRDRSTRRYQVFFHENKAAIRYVRTAGEYPFRH